MVIFAPQIPVALSQVVYTQLLFVSRMEIVLPKLAIHQSDAYLPLAALTLLSIPDACHTHSCTHFGAPTPTPLYMPNPIAPASIHTSVFRQYMTVPTPSVFLKPRVTVGPSLGLGVVALAHDYFGSHSDHEVFMMAEDNFSWG